MKELFLINNYDDGSLMYAFITSDASACCDVLQDIDVLDATFSDDDDGLEHNNQELVEELGKRRVRTLIELKEGDWLDAFLKLCEYRNIKVKELDNIQSYEY